jgi:hypothetical protein
MSLGADRRLRVYGQMFLSTDGRGRRRPLANADFILTALQTTSNGYGQIVSLSNPFRVSTDGEGKFDRSLPWETPGRVQVQALPEPEAFDIEVTDPVSRVVVQAERVISDGDGMVIDSGIAPDERPLARTVGGREFDEVGELAGYLAAGLADPSGLGQVVLARPFFEAKDSRFPSAPEKLFRHFATLLDRLQAVHLASRERAPGFDPKHVDLMVPLGFKPLEERIVATLSWHANLPAAERVRKLLASYGGADVGEDVLRRNIGRLVTLLGRILAMPVTYEPSWYLWEDMAVILTLFAGIGLVAQHNHIVWADFISRPTERELILSML